MKISRYKWHFVIAFSCIVGLLALAKCTNPEWLTLAPNTSETPSLPGGKRGEVLRHALKIDTLLSQPHQKPTLLNADGTRKKRHPVYSVPAFDTSFPDLNPVQLETAEVLGIPSTQNRTDAERHKGKLVNIQNNPHFAVRNLTHSIPYLVPRAVRLLERIATAYSDSLVVKGYPDYKLVITSVLRSEEDIAKLQRVNRNASDNSCHRYGTTFDITYNHFIDVSTGKETASVKLKSILAEVLDDFRQMGACYVKYEAHQACFHITCR